MRTTPTSRAVRGYLHGTTVDLEEAVPALDGRRVKILLQPVEESESDTVLSPTDQRQLWREWSKSGPAGPLDEDEDGSP